MLQCKATTTARFILDFLKKFCLGSGIVLALACTHSLHTFSPSIKNNWKAQAYAAHSQSQYQNAHAVLVKAYEQFAQKPPFRILDVGSGDGKITRDIAVHFPKAQVIGLDLSSSMIDFASEHHRLPHLTFIKADATNFRLPFRFDLIVSFHVLHWVKQQVIALKNIHAHLSAKGKAYLLLAASKEGLPFHTALEKTLAQNRALFATFTNTQYFYDLETYRQFLVQAGFHIDGLYYLYNERAYSSLTELKNWLVQWLPHAKHLTDPKQKARFMDQLIQAYLKEINCPDSPVLPWGEYVIVADLSK